MAERDEQEPEDGTDDASAAPADSLARAPARPKTIQPRNLQRAVKYTAEALDKIRSALSEGLPISTACKMAGVSRQTYYTWLREEPEFADLVGKAEGEREAQLIRDLRTAGSEDWRSYGWQLERTSPEFRETKDVNVNVQRAFQEMILGVREFMSVGAYTELINAVARLQGLDQGTAALAEDAGDNGSG